MGLSDLLPANLRHRWELAWSERKEKQIGDAANKFLLNTHTTTEALRVEMKRLMRAFNGAPRGPVSVAWMLTGQEHVQTYYPALLPEYHQQLLATRQCAETLAILVRRRPQGYAIEEAVIDRIIAQDNGKQSAQRELLSVLVRDAMDQQDTRPLVRFLDKANHWVHLDSIPYPDATLLKHLAQDGSQTPLPVMTEIIEILKRHGQVALKAGEHPADYLMSQACWAVDDGVEIEPAIDALLSAGVSWQDKYHGTGTAAMRIRQHASWRREALLDTLKGPARLPTMRNRHL